MSILERQVWTNPTRAFRREDRQGVVGFTEETINAKGTGYRSVFALLCVPRDGIEQPGSEEKDSAGAQPNFHSSAPIRHVVLVERLGRDEVGSSGVCAAVLG